MKTIFRLLSATFVVVFLGVGCDSVPDNGSGVTQNSDVMTVAPNQAFLVDGFLLPTTVAEICGTEDNGIMKGPDENGKLSIKCFDPKGEYKNDGKGTVECKGLEESVFETYCLHCPV